MKNKEQSIMKQLENEFPVIPDYFEGMLLHIIEDEVGTKTAERICQEKTVKKRKRNVRGAAVKWVAAASIILVCGISSVAAGNSDFQ